VAFCLSCSTASMRQLMNSNLFAANSICYSTPYYNAMLFLCY
jgi:hypothetical protein